jgi:hypothetical protein
MRRGLEIMLWSGVMQLFLIAAFTAGWMVHGGLQPSGDARMEPLPVRKVKEHSTHIIPVSLPVWIEQGSKGDLDIPETAAKEAAPSADVPPEPVDAEEPSDVVESVDVTGPEGQGAQAMEALLRLDHSSGRLQIGNFETLSLEGDAEQCLETGYMMLGDAGAPEDALEVLAQSESITMARICASNGSVVITCRLSQMTISPRRLKPNESCTD